MEAPFAHLKKLAFFALVGWLSAGCEPLDSSYSPTVSEPPTACAADQAQLEIGDGYQRIICGCAETANVVIPAGTPVTCTVPVGSVVFFEYFSVRVQHQIISLGTPSFVSSPISDPNASVPLIVFPVTFATAGTYQYEDPFDPGATGQIITH